ncbi:MAG: hypothetical protein JXR76_04470 [Deltaproteobacteria bacterium]|nr:hypothetical protein [Deltaproteobacteria bacterium]
MSIAIFIGGGCHPAPPPAAPPPAPPPPEPEDTEVPVPEVVKHGMDLSSADFAGCSQHEDAANSIWSYSIQARLNLAVQVYEGKIVAADAERLTTQLNQFSTEWKARFAQLCKYNDMQYLAPLQYQDAAKCLSELLNLQKNYVNNLFMQQNFSLDETADLMSHLTDCDAVLEPKGKKAMKDNPFSD